MANQSSKKNDASIRGTVQYLFWIVYGALGWVAVANLFYLVGEQVSIWHFLLVVVLATLTHLCFKQILKCWELQLPTEAIQYWYDILAINLIAAFFDPFTHFVWHIYWAVPIFLLSKAATWLWGYINIKYENPLEGTEEGKEEEAKRKKKEEKRERIKYSKH